MLNVIKEDTIGGRVRLARVGFNLTQKQLAELVGVGSNYLAMVERGSKNASDDLIRRIAAATHTTYEWLMGTSEHQTAYPESDGSLEQMHDNSAGLGYLVELIRANCTEKGWPVLEPEQQSAFPKTDWQPDYWFYLKAKDGPISYWVFDLDLCIYKRPDLFNKDGTMSPKIAFFNFLSNLVFGNPLIRSKTKYTFVVPSAEIFDSLLRQPTLPLGNLSLMQIDIPNKKIIREEYLCARDDQAEYLTATLRF